VDFLPVIGPRRLEESTGIPTLDEICAAVESTRFDDDVGSVHSKIHRALIAKGFRARREYGPILYTRNNGKLCSRGRVDLFAWKQGVSIAIEIDNRSPRKNSILKLRAVAAIYKIIVIRKGSWKKSVPGIDLVLTIAQEID